MERVSCVPLISIGFSEICRLPRILKGLKEDCAGENGNKDFWKEVQKLGRQTSLISSTETKRFGGISDISESTAEAVSLTFPVHSSALH